MTFNYRIIKHRYKKTVWYGLHDVFYEDKKPVAYVENPIIAGDSVEEIQRVLKMIIKDSSKPVIDEKMFK